MFSNFNQEQKVSILISNLEERYKSVHTIRERVQSVGLWVLGIMTGASGWLIQTDIILTAFEKLIYVLITLIVLTLLRFFYFEDLCKGFKSQQKIAANLEQALGFYEKGIYDNSDQSILPLEWSKAGTSEGSGAFFTTTYKLLYIGTAFLIITIVLNNHC